MNTTKTTRRFDAVRRRLRTLSNRLRLSPRTVAWALLDDLTREALRDATLREGILEKAQGG